jgi:hypothetical protein
MRGQKFETFAVAFCVAYRTQRGPSRRDGLQKGNPWFKDHD